MHYPVPPTAAHTHAGGSPHLMGNIVGFHRRMARKLAETRLVSSSHIMIGDYIIRESTNTPPVSALQSAIVCLLHIMHSHVCTCHYTCVCITSNATVCTDTCITRNRGNLFCSFLPNYVKFHLNMCTQLLGTARVVVG